MNVEVFREVPSRQEIVASWNDLARQMEEPEVFYTWEWAIASASAFAEMKTPLVVLVYRESDLIGIGALAVPARDRGPLTFLNHGTADYCDFVSAPDVREQVVLEILRELARREIRELALSNLPDNSETTLCLYKAVRRLGLYVAPTSSGRVARLRLGDAEQRKIKKQELLSKRRLRKNLVALRKLGNVTLLEYTDSKLIKNCLPNFFAAHVARFESTGLTSPFMSNAYRSFLETITHLLARRQWIRMFCLQVSEKAIAWGVVLTFPHGWLWYMPTFSLEYERFSPGMILLRMVLEKALEADSVNLVDFGVGEESYKDRFADSAISITGQIVTKSFYRYMQVRLVTKIATFLRKFPYIESRVRRLRETLRKRH